MPSLTLKNLPEDLLRALRRAAREDHRSMNGEVIHFLERSVGERVARPRTRGSQGDAQVAAWRKLAGKWKSSVDRAVEAERILRRRTAGREVEL